MEDLSKKSKRNQIEEEEPAVQPEQKKTKLTVDAIEEEDEFDRQWRLEREAHDREVKRIAEEIRNASQESVAQQMVDFFQRCQPQMYARREDLPKYQEHRWGIPGVTMKMVEKAESCARFYGADGDERLYQDYKLCEKFCDLHTFHAIARCWSHEEGSPYGSYQQCVLFHAMRHHMQLNKIPLQPVLIRLMELAVAHQYFYSQKDRDRRLKKVPGFAKIMLAVMHYSDVLLMRPDPETGVLTVLCDNIKKPAESFERLVRASLFPTKPMPRCSEERTDSLRLVAEEARRLIVKRYNSKEGLCSYRTHGSLPEPIGIVKQPQTEVYVIPDMAWW